MIVKIWPIKADYANDKSKVGGVEGLKNALEYIADKEKVIASKDDVKKMQVLNDEDIREGLADVVEHINANRVLNYMANEDKIEGKYISGYLCDPDNAIADFNLCRERTLEALHRSDKKETGAIAFHMVQSFPEGLNISDEEVHQCGIELCEKLKAHQAVVCSHIHPVTDEDGKVHGKSKHNHILFNAYIHPDKLDPKYPERAKYNDCNDTYAQLRVWNDEIAIAHGLPIIRNPDDDRIYSWKEADAINTGLSWKQRVRIDIEEAKRASNNWEDFVQLMQDAGYKIKDGEHTSYKTPDGKHTVRGHKLGRIYTKENMIRYWSYHNLIMQDLTPEKENASSPALLDVVLSTQMPLTAAVPLGMKNKNTESYYYLPLEEVKQPNETLWTYFNDEERYDICDENNRSILTATGKEIIDCMEKLRKGKQYYLDERTSQKEEKETPDYSFTDHRKKDQYYTYIFFVNSKTKKPYRTSLYDNAGRRRTMLELILLLAITVLKNESGRWEPEFVPVGKQNDAIYAPRNWKIQNMIDSIYTAKEEEIETPAQLDQRLDEAGAAYSRANSSLKKTIRAKEKMETLNEAVTQYRKTARIAQGILDMPDGPEKDRVSNEYKDVLDRYKSAKAVLYHYQVTTEEGISDFEQRYKKIQEDIVTLEENLDFAKDEYRRLKKLSYNLELAQNAQYCYGPEYSPDRIYQQKQVLESDESRNRRAEENLDEQIRAGSSQNSPEREQKEIDEELSKQ